MKTIAAATVATFSELLDLAEDETVLVTTPDGREFIVAEIDDFDEEIEAVSQRPTAPAETRDTPGSEPKIWGRLV